MKTERAKVPPAVEQGKKASSRQGCSYSLQTQSGQDIHRHKGETKTGSGQARTRAPDRWETPGVQELVVRWKGKVMNWVKAEQALSLAQGPPRGQKGLDQGGEQLSLWLLPTQGKWALIPKPGALELGWGSTLPRSDGPWP